jgi:DNA-directed RNA polymerase subunit RPC12/RpoP
VITMTYRCRSCYAKFEEEDASESWAGDDQCPECGSLDLDEIDDPEIYDEEDDTDNDLTDSFYSGDGTMEG